MCGITGWADFEQDLSGQRAIVEAMTATMACRGPDAAGTWCSERALIGHRRLAVVDIPGGVQPAADRGAVLTFSGEIYNFRELRRELEGYGHAFRTRSDTEVLLRSWLQWGSGCLPPAGRHAQMTELLHQPGAPLFDLVDQGALAAAFTADPMLPGIIGLLPSPYACAAFLLDVNEWLTEYKISLV